LGSAGEPREARLRSDPEGADPARDSDRGIREPVGEGGSRGVGDVAHVGRDAGRERCDAPGGERRRDRPQAKAEAAAEDDRERDVSEAAHANHRRGSGSLPTRSMMRYDTRDTPAPTRMSSTPAADA